MTEVTKMNIEDLQNHKDLVRINKNSIHIKVAIFTGKEGDYFVTVSPSLNVSGYGKTKKEAKLSFGENLELFCIDLMSLPKKRIEIELRNLGFKQEKLQHKNFSKMYIDENGILQNFEEGSLETNVLKTTTCA